MYNIIRNAIFRVLILYFAACGACVAEERKSLLQPSAERQTQPIFPVSNKTISRSWVQLVWDGQSGKLERQGYSIIDPLVQKGVQPFWEPNRNHGVGRSNELREVLGDDMITGDGVLTWRSEGAVRFGRENIIAQYQGSMLRGRFHGQGMWIHAGGSVYEGVWRDGLMHGSGLLTFPNGAVYNGEFRNGVFHGKGQLIDADGSVREGTFAGGKMDGRMQVSQADGIVFAARFHLGDELPGTRTTPSSDWSVLSAKSKKGSGAMGLSVTVTSDEKAPFCCDSGPPSLGYKSVSSTKELTVLPNAPDLMKIWYGKSNIVIQNSGFAQNRELAGYAEGNDSHALLNYSSKHVQPVRLRFGLKNRTKEQVKVTGAYLDMRSSRLDARPALQVLETHSKDARPAIYVIENYGWAKVTNSKLRFRFKGGKRKKSSDTMEVKLGDFNDYKTLSLHGPLAKFGITHAVLKQSLKCRTRICYNKLKSNRVFGKLNQLVHVSSGRFGLIAEGIFSFNWKNADGKLVPSSSPFTAFVPLGIISGQGECEGGNYRTVRGKKPVNLAFGQGARRIPLDINGRIKPGRRGNWLIPLQSKKSSTHRFTFVFQLSDGRKVRSRPVKLNFFRPKFLAFDSLTYDEAGKRRYGVEC